MALEVVDHKIISKIDRFYVKNNFRLPSLYMFIFLVLFLNTHQSKKGYYHIVGISTRAIIFNNEILEHYKNTIANDCNMLKSSPIVRFHFSIMIDYSETCDRFNMVTCLRHCYFSIRLKYHNKFVNLIRK